jgi:hypothetical protein
MESESHPSWIFRALAGCALGGLVGYALFAWILSRGMYAMVLPGAAVGIGCGLASKQYSVAQAALCGLLAIALGLFTEWRFFPFIKDDSLLYFLTHFYELSAFSLFMIGLGAAIAAYLGKGR